MHDPDRPQRRGFTSDHAFVVAVHDYNRSIERASRNAFDKAFALAMKKGTKP